MVRTQDFWRVRLVFSRLFCLFLPKKCHRSVAHCSPREHMDALCNQLQELMHLWLICTVPEQLGALRSQLEGVESQAHSLSQQVASQQKDIEDKQACLEQVGGCVRVRARTFWSCRTPTAAILILRLACMELVLLFPDG
eukprot:scaffold234787_cov18-Tisochrysis_lutea.AAC.1